MNINGFVDALVSHALSLALFERVNAHEPKQAPGRRTSAAFWVDKIEPISEFSGLASTSALVTMNCRVYASMLTEPQDAIDPEILEAVDALMNAYTGDFDLGGSISHIDLLGKHGKGMTADAGYVEQDGRLYRVMTISIPMVVSDAWGQVP